MASRRYMARRRMGACETTPPATPGDSHATLHKPARKDPSPLPMIRPPFVGVQLVRPRRYAAAGAPAGPLPHGDVTGSCEEDPEEQSGQPGDTTQVTGLDPMPS